MMESIGSKKKKAFTLVELILYVALASMMVIVVAAYYGSILDVEQKSEAENTVDTEATFLMQSITQNIRNASAITLPTAGNSASSLTLVMTNSAVNPTVIDLNAGDVRITEGVVPTATPVSLKSNRINVTSLTFTNLTRSGSSGIIRVAMTVSYNNNTGKQVTTYSETLYDSASLRY